MSGEATNKNAIPDSEAALYKELDKGIDDMENGRVTPHADTMEILMQRYNNYVLQNS